MFPFALFTAWHLNGQQVAVCWVDHAETMICMATNGTVTLNEYGRHGKQFHI